MAKPNFNPETIRLEHYSDLTIALRERFVEHYANDERLMPVLAYAKETGELAPSFIEKVFLPDLFFIEQCIGQNLSVSRFEGELARPDCIAHEEMALYFSLRAVEALNANDNWWLAWSTDGEDFIKPADHLVAGHRAVNAAEVVRTEWMKVLFRAVQCLPIGYMVSHSSFRAKEQGMQWNPGDEDLSQFEKAEGGTAKLFRVPTVIDARAVSHAVYLRLYPGPRIRIPGLSLAVTDFFSMRPHPSNPLFKAMNTAMHFFFYERFYPKLPFWWVTFINHHFIRDQKYRPISCEVGIGDGETDWAPADHRRMPSGEVDKDAEAQEISAVISTEDASLADRSHSATAPSVAKLTPVTVRAVENVRQRAGRNELIANDKGAVVQKHGGVLYLVVPLFFRQLSEFLNRKDSTPETLEEAFVHDGLVVSDDGVAIESAFEIKPEGATRRLGKVRAVALTQLGVRLLYPQGEKLPNNTALVPLKVRAELNVA